MRSVRKDQTAVVGALDHLLCPRLRMGRGRGGGGGGGVSGGDFSKSSKIFL